MKAELKRVDAPMELQVKNWNEWNSDYRNGALDNYMVELRDEARHWAAQAGKDPRIIEIGCGTGWLSADLTQFGSVVGIDLSTAAIELAKQRNTRAEFICGNFFTLDLKDRFDLAVSADTISHVADQARFIGRIAELVKPGGHFLLMSQNEFVLNRSSFVSAPGPGYIRHWPTEDYLKQLLAPHFRILHQSTLGELGGDQGWLRVIRARRIWKLIAAVVGKERARRAYRRLGLGSELVFVAERI
jgi:SAM-dependent methyltransferase